MTYGSRTPDTRAPSGGSLSKPIQGLAHGKFTVGLHRVEVLAAAPAGAGRWDVVLINPARHCHVERLEHWPTEWPVGTHLDVRVRAGAGLAVCRDGGRFQARDATTGAAATDWLPSVQAVYDAVPAGPWATTELHEARHVKSKCTGEWVGLRVARPPVHSAAPVQPAAATAPGDVAPAPGAGGGSAGPAGGGG